jgi:membrane protease YdiL (CAAX protease family)
VDVLGFVGLVAGYIWFVVPAVADRPGWTASFTLAAAALAGVFAWRNGVTWERAGFRVDNLPAALAAYISAGALYAGTVIFLCRDFLRPNPELWPGIDRVVWLSLWAFFQQFCLVSFLLNRLRQILGRDGPAVAAAAVLFSLLHLPNPFLTLYTLGGALILGALFLRWPSLPAATLAHAAASYAAGRLLAPEFTGWMRVGPLYPWIR